MNHILSFFIFLQLPFINPVVNDLNNIDKVHISTYEEDLTGDGFKETIDLQGELLSDSSNYYQKISIDVIRLDLKKSTLQFTGGYKPTLQFLDLNHNGHNDLFFQSALTEEDGPYQQHLYTFINQKSIEIPLPEHHYMEGIFQDNFQIQIQFSPLDKHKLITLRIDDQAEKYSMLGIYNSKGKLLEKKRAIVDSIFFYDPIQIGTKSGYGLKSYQHVYGADHSDRLGTIETLWYYENDRWVNLQTDWVSS